MDMIWLNSEYIRPWILRTTSVLLLLVLHSCSEEREQMAYEPSKDEAALIINLHTPSQQRPSTRLFLYQGEEDFSLGGAFEEKDRLRVFLRQNDTIYDMGEIPLGSISNDRTAARLLIDLPKEIDRSVPIDIVGYIGLYQDRIEVNNFGVQCPVMPYYYCSLKEFRPPLFFRVRDLIPDHKEVFSAVTQMQHIGTYEVIHLTNKSDDSITGNVGLTDIYKTRKACVATWSYYSEWAQSVPTLTLLTKYKEQEDQEDSISNEYVEAYTPEDLHTTTVQPGETKTIVNWYIPNKTPLPTVALTWAKSDDDPDFKISKQVINPRKEALLRGHAYHVYGTFDGSDIILTCSNGSDRPMPYARFSTNKNLGSTLRLSVKNPTKLSGFIDTNSNGILDEGDKEIGSFDNLQNEDIILQSSTLGLYGFLRFIILPSQGITHFEMSETMPLHRLDLSDNALNTQDLNSLYAQLPDLNQRPKYYNGYYYHADRVLNVKGNPGAQESDFEIATKKNWIIDIARIHPGTPHIVLRMGGVDRNWKILRCYIDAKKEIQDGIWIDLNGNGTKDEGESVNSTGYDKQLKIPFNTSEIHLYGNVTSLMTGECRINSYIAADNVEMEHLILGGTRLEYVDVKGHPKLKSLDLSGAYLNTSSDEKPKLVGLSSLKELTYLNLENTNIGSITEVGQLTSLMYLDISGCNLEDADLSLLSNLRVLRCNRNRIKKLSLPNSTQLMQLEVTSNEFSAEALNDLFTQIPSRVGQTPGLLFIANNPGTSGAKLSLAVKKNWIVDINNSRNNDRLIRPDLVGEDW